MNVFTSIKSLVIVLALSSVTANGQQKSSGKSTEKGKLTQSKELLKDAKAIKADSLAKSKIIADSLAAIQPLKLKPFKKNAHASYYHQKFHGKRTSSGVKFDNTKYTAAHRKFPFGTKLKITNEVNHKSVIVEVTDRGPFTKGREIDLTKKAFMEIVDNKNSGKVMVTIEEIIPAVVPVSKP
jgi:rare lipoprotein A